MRVTLGLQRSGCLATPLPHAERPKPSRRTLALIVTPLIVLIVAAWIGDAMSAQWFDRHPLALISPASEKTVSSTLGELRSRAAVLQMHPQDAAARGLAQDDPVRVFNDLGEVQCAVSISTDLRPGTVCMVKGLWRKSTYNGSTSTALVPDSLTDLGGGACFNDARVEVALLGRH